MRLVAPSMLALALCAAGWASAEDNAKPQGEGKAAPAGKIEITVPGAKTEAESKAKLRADALLARCQIKPVMTDAEIDTCRTAYRETSK